MEEGSRGAWSWLSGAVLEAGSGQGAAKGALRSHGLGMAGLIAWGTFFVAARLAWMRCRRGPNLRFTAAAPRSHPEQPPPLPRTPQVPLALFGR
jgi:hypothetical protein